MDNCKGMQKKLQTSISISEPLRILLPSQTSDLKYGLNGPCPSILALFFEWSRNRLFCTYREKKYTHLRFFSAEIFFTKDKNISKILYQHWLFYHNLQIILQEYCWAQMQLMIMGLGQLIWFAWHPAQVLEISLTPWPAWSIAKPDDLAQIKKNLK